MGHRRHTSLQPARWRPTQSPPSSPNRQPPFTLRSRSEFTFVVPPLGGLLSLGPPSVICITPMSGFVRFCPVFPTLSRLPLSTTCANRTYSNFHRAADRTYQTFAFNGTKWHGLAWLYGFLPLFTRNSRRISYLSPEYILCHHAIDCHGPSSRTVDSGSGPDGPGNRILPHRVKCAPLVAASHRGEDLAVSANCVALASRDGARAGGGGLGDELQ